MLGFLLYLIVIGAVAGFVARAVVPGPDPLGVVGTIVLGVVGSFVGGFLGWALFGEDFDEGALQASGIIGSIVGRHRSPSSSTGWWAAAAAGRWPAASPTDRPVAADARRPPGAVGLVQRATVGGLGGR